MVSTEMEKRGKIKANIEYKTNTVIFNLGKLNMSIEQQQQ